MACRGFMDPPRVTSRGGSRWRAPTPARGYRVHLRSRFNSRWRVALARLACMCPGRGSSALLVNQVGGVGVAGDRVASTVSAMEGRHGRTSDDDLARSHPAPPAPPAPPQRNGDGDYGGGSDRRLERALPAVRAILPSGAFPLRPLRGGRPLARGAVPPPSAGAALRKGC